MTVDVANFAPPKGWDLADAIRDGWTRDDIVAFAKPRTVAFNSAIHCIIAPGKRQEEQLPSPPHDDEEPPIEAPEGPQEPHGPEITDPPMDHYLCLGYDSGTYYFQAGIEGQVKELSAAMMTTANLQTLAPLSYWEREFPKTKGAGVNEAAAREALIAGCQRAGVFDPRKIRGRGAWEDDGRSVLHMGDRLLIDGKSVDMRLYQGRYIYQRAVSLGVTAGQPATTKEAFKLVEMLRLARWEKSIHADLLAGWMFVAPVCGAMLFRSHVYIIGGTGTGKSTITDSIIKPYLGSIVLACQGKTTEAAIRQTLGSDGLPILFDEAEAEQITDRVRIQGVFDLARQASSPDGAPILKGTMHGSAMAFSIRSCFAFSSINLSMVHLADENRTTIMRLRPANLSESEDVRQLDAERYAQLIAMTHDLLTDTYRARMLARAVKLIPTLRANHAVFAKVAALRFGKRRTGDQLGMMLAGLYGLHSDGVISEDKAREFIDRHTWEDQVDVSTSSSEQQLLAQLLELQVRVELDSGVGITRNLGEVVIAAQIDNERVPIRIANDSLRRSGFMQDGEYLWVSNSHSWIRGKLEKTPWASKWNETLLRLEGAKKSEHAIRFKGGVDQPVAKAVGIPLHYISKE